MFMGWFKIHSADVAEAFKILDAVAPRWFFVNDDHAMRRSLLIMSLDRKYDVELWIAIEDEADAANAKAVLPFREFGHAVWDENRQVRNCYSYTGNSTTPVPGWVIAN